MDDTLLLDAIERYKRGEMTPEEKTFFEEFRKNNPTIDQMAVEHTFFLQELEKLGERKMYEHTLNEVESELVNEGVIAKRQLKGRAKVVYLWNRYRRTISVAASIAIVISISIAILTLQYSDKKLSDITQLVKKEISDTKKHIDQIDTKIDKTNIPAKPKVETVAFGATGFLIDGNGYIATNTHVVNKARNIIVENGKGEQFYANPVYVDQATDLAILKIVDTAFHKVTSIPYTIRKTQADVGEQIFTLGYPREEIVYGEGYLSSKSGYSGDTTAYQVTIPVNPGNSGGPVLNKNGEVIGIISSKQTNADGVVFAIKSKNIYNALDEIKKDEPIKLPSGASLKNLDRVQQIKKIEDCVFMVKGN